MKRIFDQQHKNHYDMVIVGGGISGAFVAYEAASRGLKVALFEKGDFGEATSAATSKLIHGGLRYLANLEFGLVRESLIERRVLENIAPNFVYPLPMLIPTYKNIKSSKYLLTAGMLLYDLLSFDKSWTWDDSKKIPMHRTIGKKKTKLLAPLVPQRKLSGSSIFYDCQNINPERLTLGVIKSAASYGAHMANYAKMEQLIVESEIVKGVIVKDLLSGKSHKIDADITINATGPWSDIVLKTTGNLKNIDHHIRRSEGIHLIVKKMVDDHAITIVTKKKRHVFMLPWRNHTIIGTTDKAYSGKPDDYSVSEKSIAELLEEINASLDKQYHISKKDILYSYGGMRPLVEKETEGTYNA
ncbi:MAG: glycerol-3-phosphate dehydrogenase, partial [Bacteroidetes bacterium 4572_77]